MKEFKNVTVTKAANFYFDGKVTSRTVTFSDGSIKTLGIMMIGDYEFNTADKEIMQIISGEVEVYLPDSKKPIVVKEGGEFEVEADSNFHITVKKITDYCCSYI